MNDPAVAARLVQRDPGLLLEDDHSCARSSREDGEARGEADDAAPDDDRVDFREVLCGGAHGSTVT